MASEKRLIYANDLKKALRTAKGADAVGHSIVKLLKIDTIIDEAVTADAVEVVRCKDCKWYKEGELLAPNKFCFRLKHPTEDRNVGYNFCDDDFCSYGERRNDG